MEKNVSRVEGSFAYLSGWVSQRFLNFLKKNTWQTVKEKQRVGSASRMTLFRW